MEHLTNHKSYIDKNQDFVKAIQQIRVSHT